MVDLFPAATAAAAGERRVIVPARELGAYEALWDRPSTSFATLAREFRRHPGALPSDFVPTSQTLHYSRVATAALHDSGITEYGVCLRATGDYPAGLEYAEPPLELLYFQGRWELTRTRCIAIVGTRRPSIAGLRRAASLATHCVRAGFTVVSGLASGVDTAAHSAALEAGGDTIAVLGTPLTACYPAANAALQRRIARDCLLVSQVPFVRYARQPVARNRQFFRERNVTLSALCAASVIVEAGNTSGALIEARHALLQRRPLFVFDSCCRDPALSWPARLLALGAIRVTRFDEITASLGGHALRSGVIECY